MGKNLIHESMQILSSILYLLISVAILAEAVLAPVPVRVQPLGSIRKAGKLPAMDTATNGRLNEVIGKEVRYQKKIAMEHEQRMLEWGLLKPLPKPLKKTSSAINFLDQTLGLQKTKINLKQ